MNNLEGSNVFVTGGMGLVGSHVVESLIKLDCQIVVGTRAFDTQSYFERQKLGEKVVSVNYDLKDFQRILDILSKYEIDTIIHLGAQPIVNTAYLNPFETLNSNIGGTINILEAARQYGQIKSIVVASSDKAYGKSEILPYTEDMKLGGKHPYDCSKSCTDLISRMYAETYNLPITVARFGNIFGPGDLNFNRIIPGAMKALLKNATLELRSDGSMVREYLYVKDVAKGYLLLADNIEKVKGEAFNFGTGEAFTVLDILKEIGKAVGKEVPYKILNTAKGEIPAQYLDSNKLQKTLNWHCDKDLGTALKETYEWYKECFS